MAEKDIAEKTFIRLNDVFADIFNGLIFKGEQIVTPDSLEVMDVSSQYRTDDWSIHEMERDVLKLWKNCGLNLVALGVENQTEADKDMPFRVVAYDGSVYRSQLLKTETKCDNNGLISVLSKKRYPVITIVLYFNDKKGWNYPKNIKNCFNPPLSDNEVMNRLDEYISDYRITVFDIGGMSMEDASVFKSDFREIAEHFIKMRSGEEYVPSTRTITHVDEFLKLMTALTGDKDYEKLIENVHNNNSKEKERITMCRIMQEALSKGLKAGVEEGRRIGVEEGHRIGVEEGHRIGVAMAMVELVEKIAKENSVSVLEALDMLNITSAQYDEYQLILLG